MTPVEPALFDACRTLFGDEIHLDPGFLDYLQPSGARTAFRSRAKEHHPDRFAAAPPEVRSLQTARFREIHQAYTLLSDFLACRQCAPARPSAQPAPAPRPPRPARRRPAAAPRDLPGLPPLPLEFGIFAYYCGRISYRTLIDALVWQRRQRPALGAIARQWGWLSESQVNAILDNRGLFGRFGRKAVELGLLNPLQVAALLRHQRSRQQRLGQYFIDRGLLSPAETDRLASDLERHNARYADRQRG